MSALKKWLSGDPEHAAKVDPALAGAGAILVEVLNLTDKYSGILVTLGTSDDILSKVIFHALAVALVLRSVQIRRRIKQAGNGQAE